MDCETIGSVVVDVLLASGQNEHPEVAAVATRMPFISGPSGYMLMPLREGADFTLYRGRQHGNPSSILAIALSAEQPSAQSLKRLEHECSLAAKLDPAGSQASGCHSSRRANNSLTE